MTTRIDDNGVKLAEEMGMCGFPSTFIKGFESPLGDTYFFELVNPLSYSKERLKKAVEKLSVANKVDMRFENTKEAHYSIFVSNETNNFLSLYECLVEVGGQEIVIGKDDKGRLVKLDFDHIPHLLIAGTTGSGKSVLLNNLIVNFLCYYGDENHPRKSELLIIDPKGSEFRKYKNLGCVNFCEDTHEAIEWLETIEHEMDKRYKLANPMSDHDIIVIIDELADLMLTSKFKVEQSIVRLAQKGRACGIHLIVATQRPTIDVISGLIKANMPYRIALKTAGIRDSIVILDHKGCETLRGNGDCIVKTGLNEYHTQIAYAEKELEQHFIKLNVASS